MNLSFFGAAEMVTGSNYMINTEHHNILIDCGMFQGNQEIEKMNFREFPFNPSDVDILILTHAHIDHSGRIPKLVKEGFRGKIIATKATFDLCGIMLMDSAKIQESDAVWDNKKKQRAGLPFVEPLYTSEDAEQSLKYFETYLYDQKVDINHEISLRFRDAGHILGSSILEIWITEKDITTKIVFSGDIGMPGRPIINKPEFIENADYLVIESTYGDTIHPPFSESTEKMIKIINETAERGGTVLIPSFAVGRTQELIYELNHYYENTDLQQHKKVPVYIDSPMAVNATEVFQRNSGSFNQETQKLILSGDNPFAFENLNYVRSQEESMALNKSSYPKVIISASGMATAGRIRHHLKHNLWDPKNSLIFVGYQAEGTLGRLLLDGIKRVKILGEEVNVALQIHNLEGFSGHADQPFLLEWLGGFKKIPKKIFLVHGETDVTNIFAKEIEKKYGIQPIIPKLGNSYNVSADFIEVKKGMTIEPEILKDEIAKELENVLNQFNALAGRSSGLLEEKLLIKDFDLIKNRLLELQGQLMDLNMMIGK